MTTPTKSDTIARSPGSPATPVPRSKRKEGKRIQSGTEVVCLEFPCLKIQPIIEAKFGCDEVALIMVQLHMQFAGVRSALLRRTNAFISK